MWMDGCRVRDTVILGRENGREEGGEGGRVSLSLFHVGKQEITREGREGCDSVSAVIRIVSPLQAQYSTSRATYPRSRCRSLPLRTGIILAVGSTERQ